MNGESLYPEELLPSNMFPMKRSPILWIGSGISKRFAENFLTWDELLSEVASRFGVGPDTYTALKMEASMEVEDPDMERDLVCMKTASKLSSRLVSMFADGTLRPADLLSEGDLEQYRHGVDPFKLLVCSSMGKAVYREGCGEELECFRALRDSVPAVVTTNYDTVVEDLFGDGFKVFNDVDEYYGQDSIGMGEIYKIHGTVRMPRGIVITENDYRRFESRRPIVSAKILSLMCEAPLLIIGHSADDRIVRDSIRDMFNGFSREKASEVARNIVFIQYREGASPEWGIMMIDSRNGALPIQMVILDDMLPIFRDASRYRRTLTVGQIRMLRRMMSDVSLTPDPNNDPRMAYAGIEGIDDVDPDRTVIALASRVYLDAAKSFSSYSIDDIIRDVLGSRSLPAESVVKVWFEERRQGGVGTYCPIFDYVSDLNLEPEMFSDRLSGYVDEKRSQYGRFFTEAHRKFSSVVDGDTMAAMMHGANRKFYRPDLVAYCYHAGIVNRAESEHMLKMIFDDLGGRSDTSMKRAVTYLGFKDSGLE